MFARDVSPIPRRVPYTYATWLGKVIAGEQQCHYAGWFKSHFSIKRASTDANLDAWTAAHTAMVHDVAGEFRARGYKVYLEDQNTIRVRGSGGAVLVGKPDIVAVKGDTAIVTDCKTGEPRTRDTLQVRLYMYLLGAWSTHPAKGCRRILGEVRYDPEKADPIFLPHAAADGIDRLMKRYMRVFLSPAPPEPVPSFRECRFCDLIRDWCPNRIEREDEMVEISLF